MQGARAGPPTYSRGGHTRPRCASARRPPQGPRRRPPRLDRAPARAGPDPRAPVVDRRRPDVPGGTEAYVARVADRGRPRDPQAHAADRRRGARDHDAPSRRRGRLRRLRAPRSSTGRCCSSGSARRCGDLGLPPGGAARSSADVGGARVAPGRRPWAADRGGEGPVARRVRRDGMGGPGRPCAERDGRARAGLRRAARRRSRRRARPPRPRRRTRGTRWRAGDEFVLIDPDGLLAEPEYDLGVIIREDPVEELGDDLHARPRGSRRAPGSTRRRSGSGAWSSGSRPASCASRPACSPRARSSSPRPTGSPRGPSCATLPRSRGVRARRGRRASASAAAKAEQVRQAPGGGLAGGGRTTSGARRSGDGEREDAGVEHARRIDARPLGRRDPPVAGRMSEPDVAGKPVGREISSTSARKVHRIAPYLTE